MCSQPDKLGGRLGNLGYVLGGLREGGAGGAP